MSNRPSDDMQWSGPDDESGCSNPKCSASARWRRVLSKREIERVYNTPTERESLPFDWPLADGVTHACTRCGFVYYGSRRASFSPPSFDVDDAAFTPDEVDVEIRVDRTPGENTRRLIEAAPDDVTLEQIVTVIKRFVPGAGRATAEHYADECDTDVASHPADEFM